MKRSFGRGVMAAVAFAALVAIALITVRARRSAAGARAAPSAEVADAAEAEEGREAIAAPALAQERAAERPAERRSAAEPADRDPARTLRVLVVDAAGAPVPGLDAVAFDARAVLAAARTGASGEAELLIDAPRADLVVLRESAALRTLQDLAPSPDPVRIVLPGARRVSGVVRVGGAPPEEPLELVLRAADERGGLSDPPPVVAAHFGWRGFRGMPRLAATTGVNGAFAFDGLTDAWRGRLSLPDGYRLADGEHDVELPAPAEDLVIDALREPLLTGRIVDHRGAPVAGADVSSHVACADGSVAVKRTTDADGRFVVLLQCDETVSVHLEAGKAAVGIGSWSFENLPALGLGERDDLGDLALTPVRDVLAVVRDPGGAPVAGAILRPCDLGAMKSAPTNAEGTVVFAIPEGCERVHVDALGHLPADATVLGSPLDVQVETGSNLRIRRGAGEGADLLVVHALEAIFVGGDGCAPDEAQVALGASGIRSRRSTMDEDGRVELTLELPFDDAGQVLLTNLRAGARIGLRARWTGGEPGAEIQVVAPLAGWLDVTLADAPGAYSGMRNSAR